jgi:radical SAM protein (TIGR01212 family)
MSKSAFWNNAKRYYDLKSFFINTFGYAVYKIQIDAGFTCPNRDGTIATGGCIYCNGKGSVLREQGPLPSVAEQIAAGKALYKKMRGAEKFIAYFQTFTNTYAPVEHLKSLYDEALHQENIIGLAIGTRPDCVPEAVLALIEGYAQTHHVWIEYGLQSIHDRTLQSINRGHDAETFYEAVRRTTGRNIHICTHIIIGLPGETRDDIMKTAERIAALPVQGIKIHLLLALRGTKLGSMYTAGNIRMLSKDEYVATVCDVLEILPPEMVIQRLTADGYRDLYLAPDWGRNKLDVLNAINGELERRDSWQGKRYPAGQG